MIKYQVIKENNVFSKIQVSGHALFDKQGSDIVCASVSTSIIMTINQIEIFGLAKEIEYQLKEGSFALIVLQSCQNLEFILTNLVHTLTDLSQQYPKHIQNQGG